MNRVSTIRIASDSAAVQQMDEQVKSPGHKVEQLATKAYHHVSLDWQAASFNLKLRAQGVSPAALSFVNLQPLSAIEMRAQNYDASFDVEVLFPVTHADFAIHSKSRTIASRALNSLTRAR